VEMKFWNAKFCHGKENMIVNRQLLAAMGLGLVVVSASLATQAQEPQANAHTVVRQATAQVLVVVRSAPGYVKEDPQRYFSEIHTVLDPVIDYPGFARAVMGTYASRKHYQSLDSAGKKQLRAQLERFTEVMRVALVRTYGKGLLAFGSSRVETEEPAPGLEDDAKQVSVVQQIYNSNDVPYVIHYQMHRDKSGAWKLRNLIIEAINLGQVYRNQFMASVRQHDGDIDAVIANWGGLG